MLKLHPTQDSRTRYDPKTGAVRAFFGAELVESPDSAERGFTKEHTVERFLTTNRTLFKLDGVTLQQPVVAEGANSQSVRYEQHHAGIPVYGATLVIGQNKRDGLIASAVNTLDYELPATLSPNTVAVTADEALALLHRRFDGDFATLTLGQPTLYVYRHPAAAVSDPPRGAPPIRNRMLALSTGHVGQVYLVWHVPMYTRQPNGSWDVLIDATDGTLVAVSDRRAYATRKANVFWPDPIRSRQDDTLTAQTAEATLNQELVEVDLDHLDAPVNNVYRLNGTYVKNIEIEGPAFAPPETTGDFTYGAKDRKFLNVMAYFYLDQLVTYLQSLGCSAYTTAITSKGPIQVDPQAVLGDDNSYFDTDANGKPYICLGEGGVPDASDPGVIVHEYGHALEWYLLGDHTNSSYEEGFNDFLAACWLDRYNAHQFQREEAMPWDQHAQGTTHWGSTRRMDLQQQLTIPAPAGVSYLQGDIYATALWDWFLNIGGTSPDPIVRRWAADEIIRTYLDMIVLVQTNRPPEVLVNGLIQADMNRTGGLYKKVIWDAFRRRGLWTEFTPVGNIDLYVRDSDADTGAHASPEIHWASPDIWVRNTAPAADPTDPSDPNAGENPDDGHQSPINDVPNYLYVRVHNRGSQAVPANAFTLEAYHCNPGTAMQWSTHFTSMGTLAITSPIPANGAVRVGPFTWTPQIVDHECLLAVVRGTSDPTIADAVNSPVDHWKLVRYDNNVGQRNVSPAPSTPGGKTTTSFLVRGTTQHSMNTLSIDARPLPADTIITVRIARSIADHCAARPGLDVHEQNSRWTTFRLPGGTLGMLQGFPLAANEAKSVTLMIDFSYQAEHLTRYPLIVSQEQDGMLAGRLTIEITAVKESEDYVYGNARTQELHTLGCAFRTMMHPHHQVPFQSIKDALARGYNGCRYCLPEYSTD